MPSEKLGLLLRLSAWNIFILKMDTIRSQISLSSKARKAE
jgi:hypothetical protein